MIIKYGVTGILLFLLIMLSVNMSVAQQELGKIKCICIDAGHGGKDPGAVGTKTYEKNIVLPVALKLGKLIEKTYPDIKVVYIRKTDVFVELKERTRVANSHKADLFISVHVNSLDIKKNPKAKYVRGIETYVLGTHNSDHNLEVAMKENSVIHYEKDYSIKYEDFNPSRAESYIMFSMLRNIHLDKSLILASMIHENLVEITKGGDREVRQGPLWVLKDVAMPSVLVEIGYISNVEDERFMMSESGQVKIVNGIFKGFQAYKEKMERKAALNLEKIVAEKQTETEEQPLENKGPLYAIQVASATTQIKKTAALCPGRKVHELKSEGRYRYYVVPSAELEKVKDSLKEVRTKVKDCFIIAIYKGKMISVAEARKLESK